MGEADAARLLVSASTPTVSRPRWYQVGVQSALAKPTRRRCARSKDGARQGRAEVAAAGHGHMRVAFRRAERAAADIEAARRRGRIGGIDLALADKVVGAGAETARAVTIEWEPVDRLERWRYGLSTATGMMPPERLIKTRQAADPRLAGAGADAFRRSSACRRRGSRPALGVLSARR